MKNRIRIAVVVMGFSGLVAEILLLRELLIVFSGNELSIGIILANWLILEAFGSFVLGRKAGRTEKPLETFTAITIFFSLALLIAIFLTRILKNAIGISIGESVGFLPMFYSSFFILLPVGILHGALFPFGCRIYAIFSGQDQAASFAGRVYVYETVGTIVGGVACTYLLITSLHTFQASLGVAMLNFIVCLFLVAPHWETGRLQKTIVVILSLLVVSSGFLVVAGQADRLHDYAIKAQWKNQNVVHYQNSQYGNICIIENQGQYIFFLDGVPELITPIPDIPFVEEFVHLPLLAHPEPARLFVLSGGAGGVLNEALKHPSIERVEYAELDPLLLDLIERYPTPLTESELNDERVEIKHTDGRLFLNTTREEYDLILVGIMEPSNLQTNRFFTQEFFSLAKKRLSGVGILAIGLPGSLDYVNEELKDLNSSIFHTLKSVFANTRVIPGDGTNLFLASDSGEISTIGTTQVVERLNQRNIQAEVIVPWHIENKLHQGWQDWFDRFIEGSSEKINYDFNPVGLFYSVAHWNALYAPALRGLFRQFERINLQIIMLLFAVFLLLYFFLRWKSKRVLGAAVPYSIITTGFAGMIFDLVSILAFQSIYGYVFSWIGLLVAIFMAGAASGAMLMTTALARIRDPLGVFKKTELAIIGFSIAWPIMFLAFYAYLEAPMASFPFRMLLLAFSFIGGLLIGCQFPLANKIYVGKRASVSETAGLLYASDLLGGWFGGIIGAVVLLPVLGLVGTCITVGLLKLTSFIVITTQPDHRL